MSLYSGYWSTGDICVHSINHGIHLYKLKQGLNNVIRISASHSDTFSFLVPILCQHYGKWKIQWEVRKKFQCGSCLAIGCLSFVWVCGFFLFCFLITVLFAVLKENFCLGCPFSSVRAIVIHWQIPPSRGLPCCLLSFKEKYSDCA